MDGKQLYAQAQKLEAGAGGGGFGNWFGGGKQDKLEQAIELYVQAGNAFRTSNLVAESGGAFERAAMLSKQINEPNDAANYHTEAFKVYRRTQPRDAARVMRLAIEHYALTNVRRAATNKQTLAEMLELDDSTKAEALAEYEQAGNWFANDNAEALANKCFIKVGELAGWLGDYAKATSKFEEVSHQSLGNNLMRWSVKEYLFKSAICHLASRDTISMKRALDQYVGMDQGFAMSPEFGFITDLVNAYEEGDGKAYDDRVFRFKHDYRLDDPWKQELLFRARKGIEESDNDLT